MYLNFAVWLPDLDTHRSAYQETRHILETRSFQKLNQKRDQDHFDQAPEEVQP